MEIFRKSSKNKRMEALLSASSLSKKKTTPKIQTESIKTFGKNGNQQTQKKRYRMKLEGKRG